MLEVLASKLKSCALAGAPLPTRRHCGLSAKFFEAATFNPLLASSDFVPHSCAMARCGERMSTDTDAARKVLGPPAKT